MKKFLILIAVVLISSTAFSQISFGPKVGYTTSELSVDKTDIKTSLKNSLQFGLFLRLGEDFYIQPEVNWLTQGGLFHNPSLIDGISPFEQEVTLKTIQIPAMVGVKLIDLKLLNLRIHGGPVASIITDKEIENKVANYIAPIKEIDIADMIWSFQVGAGIDVLMFTLDVRYNIGINKLIGDVNVDGTNVTFDSKTSGFTVGLGWKIF